MKTINQSILAVSGKFLCAFFLINIVITSFIMGTETHSTTFSDGTQVHHQFEFKKLSDEDKKKLTLVFERGKRVIDKSKGESAVVFPAQPCIALAAKIPRAITQVKTVKDRTFVAHVHYSNRVTDIPKEIEAALEIGVDYSSSDLMVSLFSKKLDTEHCDVTFDHGGRSQEEHMKFVKDTIISHFGIKDHQVQTYLFDTKQHNQEIENGLMHLTAFTDGSEHNGSIKFYTISPGSEGYTNNWDIAQRSFDFTRKSYGRLRMSPCIWNTIWGYNKVPFAKVPKYNMASLNATTSAINPYTALFDNKAPLNLAITIAQGAASIAKIAMERCARDLFI
jgi:hypothetical protein